MKKIRGGVKGTGELKITRCGLSFNLKGHKGSEDQKQQEEDILLTLTLT